MRTMVRNYRANGSLESEELTPLKSIPDEVEILLSWASTDKVTIHRQNASFTTYGPIEYECDWCEEYGHAEDACPVKAEMEQEGYDQDEAGQGD